jgi:hypothetical protein
VLERPRAEIEILTQALEVVVRIIGLQNYLPMLWKAIEHVNNLLVHNLFRKKYVLSLS